MRDVCRHIGNCSVSTAGTGCSDANFTAGKRGEGGERLPLGRPGEYPQGFGTQTGLPNCVRTYEKARRTRVGVRRSRRVFEVQVSARCSPSPRRRRPILYNSRADAGPRNVGKWSGNNERNVRTSFEKSVRDLNTFLMPDDEAPAIMCACYTCYNRLTCHCLRKAGPHV